MRIPDARREKVEREPSNGRSLSRKRGDYCIQEKVSSTSTFDQEGARQIKEIISFIPLKGAAKVLVGRVSDMNLKDAELGWTALHWAAKGGTFIGFFIIRTHSAKLSRKTFFCSVT